MRAFLLLLGSALVAFASITIGDLVSKELRGRLHTLPYGLLVLASRRLPMDLRQRYLPEWQGELHAVLHHVERFPITRLWKGIAYAAGVYRAANTLVAIHRGASASAWRRRWQSVRDRVASRRGHERPMRRGAAIFWILPGALWCVIEIWMSVQTLYGFMPGSGGRVAAAVLGFSFCALTVCVSALRQAGLLNIRWLRWPMVSLWVLHLSLLAIGAIWYGDLSQPWGKPIDLSELAFVPANWVSTLSFGAMALGMALCSLQFGRALLVLTLTSEERGTEAQIGRGSVEVAFEGPRVILRAAGESREMAVEYSRSEWDAFVADVRRGLYDED